MRVFMCFGGTLGGGDVLRKMRLSDVYGWTNYDKYVKKESTLNGTGGVREKTGKEISTRESKTSSGRITTSDL